MDLEKNYLRDIAAKTLIDRGSAEILEEDNQGIFIKDTLSVAYILICEDYNRGVEWLLKHKKRGYELLLVYRRDLSDYAVENLGLQEEMVCSQVVWTKSKPPERAGSLDIIQATEKHIPFLRENYAEWEDEWCMELFRRGNLYVATLDESTPIGFIGEHLEGTAGLLFVLPEYRNRGFATEMEAFIIEQIINKGLVPYGHVVQGNEESLALQRKMGFEFWDGEVFWLFNGETGEIV